MSETGQTWLGIPARGKRLVQAGLLLGLGIGGFFDGIVFIRSFSGITWSPITLIQPSLVTSSST